jgi:DNA-binding transcriptional MerR regulator
MFRIGEFSKIAQVSGRLLRYYEEIGLLKPEYSDPQTGYRYYSARQLPRLNRILVLKELGLSLDQVARLLDEHTSTAEIRGMLVLRKAQIEQAVQEERERLRVVETRLQQIDTHGHLNEPDVILKAIPPQQFLSLRGVMSGMDAIRRTVQRISTVVPAKLGANNLNNIALIIHSPIFDPQSLDIEIGYLLHGSAPSILKLSEEQILTGHSLDAVETMATLVHVGRIDERHVVYGTLGTWVEQNNWQICGDIREILMQLPLGSPEDEAVIEIQFPVSRNEKIVG